MHTYAALLRGINLGKRNRVPMGELREVLTQRGFVDVRTHLQSGNVVFDHDSADPDPLAAQISEAVAEHFGVQAAVLVRTARELADVVEGNPLGGEPSDPAKFLIAFLEPAPALARVRDLDGQSFGEDRLWLAGREAYLWLPGGVRDSELGKFAWDKRLGVTATLRNWNTVTRLAAMAGE